MEEKFSFKNFLIIFSTHILAVGALFHVNPTNIGAWIAAHLFFSSFGASISLHRYFTHRTFKAHFLFEQIMALVGTLCMQGSIQFWVSAHRDHHQKSERYGDPHSATRGFFWSHMGWLLFSNPNGYSYLRSLKNIPDLREKRYLRFYEKRYLEINLAFLGLIYVVCLYFGRPELFYFLGPLRIVSVWHCTWLLNSFCHSARFSAGEIQHGLKNSHFVSILIGGEGYHEAHHKNPSSIKPYNRKIHFDFSYLILRGLRAFKIVHFSERSVTR